ncbi:hypothetical protein MRB53_037780 [Persea americana]|nr:hypothetical protein MRB53_037780 [Persea americana]
MKCKDRLRNLFAVALHFTRAIPLPYKTQDALSANRSTSSTTIMKQNSSSAPRLDNHALTSVHKTIMQPSRGRVMESEVSRHAQVQSLWCVVLLEAIVRLSNQQHAMPQLTIQRRCQAIQSMPVQSHLWQVVDLHVVRLDTPVRMAIVLLKSASSSSSSPSLSTTTITSTVLPVIQSSTAAPVANTTAAPDAAAIPTQQQSFNGSSFAAGFVPGIVIGILILLAFFWLIARRKKGNQYGSSEKSKSQDQLTTLSPHPAAIFSHNRSISERLRPQKAITDQTFYDQRLLTTQELLQIPRKLPLKVAAFYQPLTLHNQDTFTIRPCIGSVKVPARGTGSTSSAHMKRGTLSYRISPIRQLKTKQSMHSLRRHMLLDNANMPQGLKPQHSQRSRRSPVVRSNSSGSTETIRILMSPDEPYTPPRDDRNLHAPAIMLDTRGQNEDERHPITSSLYSPSATIDTPTRKPSRPQPGPLAHHIHQDNGAQLVEAIVDRESLDPPPVPRLPEEEHDDRRMTTFSSLLERAGLYQESLGKAPQKK